MAERELQRGRSQRDTMAFAGCSKVGRTREDLGRGRGVGVRRARDRPGRENSGREHGADDHADAALENRRKLGVEHGLVEQRVGHGDQEEIEIEPLQPARQHPPLVDSRADGSDQPRPLQLIERSPT
jgi:hypothetical protein